LLVHGVVDDLEEERVLRRVVVVERGLGEAGLLGDRVERRRRDAPLEEDTARGFDDFLARALAPSFAPRDPW